MKLRDEATGKLYKVLRGELVEIPEKTPVDMSVLLSCSRGKTINIDCEFKDLDSDHWVIGKLTSIGEGINGNAKYWKKHDGTGSWFTKCRPRLNHWLSIIDAPNDIQLKLVNAGFSVYKNGNSIIIEGLHSDRCYPWEANKE